MATKPSPGWIVVSRTAFSYFTITPGYLRVPERIHSPETLSALCLSPDTARMVFAHFNDFKKDPRNEEYTILDCAKDYIMSIQGDASEETDDWAGIMQEMGLDEEFVSCMLGTIKEGYSRKTSLKDEVLYYMDDRYKELMGIEGRVKAKWDVEGCANPRRIYICDPPDSFFSIQ